MKTVAAFLLINLIIVVTNLMAATVVVILAPLARTIIHDADSLWWPWAIIMTIATAMALNVMKAATEKI